MNPQILNYTRAGCAGIVVVSHEEARVEAEIMRTAQAAGYSFYVWSLTEGISHVTNAGDLEPIPETDDPVAMLSAFPKLPGSESIEGGGSEKAMLLARDFHAFLGPDANPMVVRKLRDAITLGKQTRRVLVILGCQLRLPPEVEKDLVVVDYKLPDRDQRLEVLRAIADSAGIKLKDTELEPILDASAGMTTMECENAFALSVAETKRITPDVVHREKSGAVRKNGLLEIVETATKLDDIGGLDVLKRDLFEKRNLFTKHAKEYGLPTPRGLLVVGQPGTGKSLTASATATTFNLPLLRLEAGRLFGSLVGQSEENWRKAFATVKAVAPCILWIDEVDGLFSGSTGASHDGGTSQRVVKAILQDMQFNGDGVFFMFTANDIDQLPDPLIDRLDVWSVDLPTQSERVAIWRIHIAKRKRDPKRFKLEELATRTEGFSGRQIEQVWLKAMTLAFNDGGREPTMVEAVEAVSRVTPTSKTMSTQIEARRTRLAGRATPASNAETTVAASPTVAGKTPRKLGA